jgi:hypothetical protein
MDCISDGQQLAQPEGRVFHVFPPATRLMEQHADQREAMQGSIAFE